MQSIFRPASRREALGERSGGGRRDGGLKMGSTKLSGCGDTGVNFLDAYQRMGLYKTPLPFVPGMEGAGFIEKSEPEARLKPGTRVAWAEHPGAYAQFAAIPVELPEEVDARTGAAALLQGMTAEYLCETTYPARAGDVALVHAGLPWSS
jgi:NADPH2:quinone reductase